MIIGHEISSGYGTITNASATVTPIGDPGSQKYFNVTDINVVVYTAAVGGSGTISIRDTADTVIHTVDADAVGSVNISHMYGLKMAQGVGMKAVTTGAVTTQASASVSISGYWTTK